MKQQKGLGWMKPGHLLFLMTTVKTFTSHMSFMLTNGIKALIPIQVSTTKLGHNGIKLHIIKGQMLKPYINYQKIWKKLQSKQKHVR